MAERLWADRCRDSCRTAHVTEKDLPTAPRLMACEANPLPIDEEWLGAGGLRDREAL